MRELDKIKIAKDSNTLIDILKELAKYEDYWVRRYAVMNDNTLNKKSPKLYKRNPEYIEIKSRRVQLVLQPTVVDALKELAKEKDLSMNETANEAILAYLEKEGKIKFE